MARTMRKLPEKIRASRKKLKAEKARERKQNLKVYSFLSCRSDGDASRIWIDRAFAIHKLPDMYHRDFLLDERNRRRHRLEIPKSVLHDARLNPRDDHAITLFAINQGFTRINYEFSGGKLTVETNANTWENFRRRLLSAIIDLVEANKRLIDEFYLHIIDDTGIAREQHQLNRKDMWSFLTKRAFTARKITWTDTLGRHRRWIYHATPGETQLKMEEIRRRLTPFIAKYPDLTAGKKSAFKVLYSRYECEIYGEAFLQFMNTSYDFDDAFLDWFSSIEHIDEIAG